MEKTPLSVPDYSDTIGMAMHLATVWNQKYTDRDSDSNTNQSLHARWKKNEEMRLQTKSTRSEDYMSRITINKFAQIVDTMYNLLNRRVLPPQNITQWVPTTKDEDNPELRMAVLAYAVNKITYAKIKEPLSQCIMHQILKGVGILDVGFEVVHHTSDDGLRSPDFVNSGPVFRSVNPFDIVWEEMVDFKQSWKIERSQSHIGMIQSKVEQTPQDHTLRESFEMLKNELNATASMDQAETDLRTRISENTGINAWWSNAREQRDQVELLEFRGDIWCQKEGKLHRHRRIVVWNRAIVALNEELPLKDTDQYFSSIARPRPDTSIGMSLMDQLVGIQESTDFLYNNISDMLALSTRPPTVIKGQMLDDDVGFEPGASFQFQNANGSIDLMRIDHTPIQVAFQMIARNHAMMDEMVGITPELRGFRTPAEKTLGEVSLLADAAINPTEQMALDMEVHQLEPAYNCAIQLARHYGDGGDFYHKLSDEDSFSFVKVSPKDLGEHGKIKVLSARRSMSARKILQDLQAMTPLMKEWGVHDNGDPKAFQALFQSLLGIEGADLFRDAAQIISQAEKESMRRQANKQVNVTQAQGGSVL